MGWPADRPGEFFGYAAGENKHLACDCASYSGHMFKMTPGPWERCTGRLATARDPRSKPEVYRAMMGALLFTLLGLTSGDRHIACDCRSTVEHNANIYCDGRVATMILVCEQLKQMQQAALGRLGALYHAPMFLSEHEGRWTPLTASTTFEANPDFRLRGDTP